MRRSMDVAGKAAPRFFRLPAPAHPAEDAPFAGDRKGAG